MFISDNTVHKKEKKTYRKKNKNIINWISFVFL